MNIQITIKGDCSNVQISSGKCQKTVNNPTVVTINGVKQEIPPNGVVVFNGNVISGGNLVISG